MRRFDNENDEAIRPFLEAAAQAYCEDENANKVLDEELCVATAVLSFRAHNRLLAQSDEDEPLPICDCQAKDDQATYHTEGCPCEGHFDEDAGRDR